MNNSDGFANNVIGESYTKPSRCDYVRNTTRWERFKYKWFWCWFGGKVYDPERYTRCNHYINHEQYGLTTHQDELGVEF